MHQFKLVTIATLALSLTAFAAGCAARTDDANAENNASAQVFSDESKPRNLSCTVPTGSESSNASTFAFTVDGSGTGYLTVGQDRPFAMDPPWVHTLATTFIGNQEVAPIRIFSYLSPKFSLVIGENPADGATLFDRTPSSATVAQFDCVRTQ